MKHTLVRRALAPLLVLAVAAGNAAAAPAPAVQNGISESTRAWMASVESGDMATVTRMHPAAMTGFPMTDNQADGQAMTEAYRAMFAKYRAHATVEDGHYLRSGDLLMSWGRFSLELKPRDGGETMVLKGRYSDIAHKTPTGWHYLLDHASVLPKLP
jgi:ketosteroid isomerase-like protein